MGGPSLTFLSLPEQEASFIPRPWPLASQPLGEFTSHCLPTTHRGPDVMPVSWVAKHSQTHHTPGEAIRESSSVTAARKCRTALSLAARSQRASCWKTGSLSAERRIPVVFRPKGTTVCKTQMWRVQNKRRAFTGIGLCCIYSVCLYITLSVGQLSEILPYVSIGMWTHQTYDYDYKTQSKK